MHPLEAILRRCAEAAPQPWYPSLYAEQSGTARDTLDPYLDQLRMAGLVHLTDWVQGRGQGYALTPQGQEVLHNPRYLARLVANGEVPRLEHLEPRPPVEAWQPIHERREAIREALLGPHFPAVTYALIFLNVLWFLAGLAICARRNIPTDAYLSGAINQDRRLSAVIDDLGGENLIDILFLHQWWRLLTTCFVHMGWIHLGANMFSLYVVGPLLERMWGSWRYLFLYVLSGLVGSAATVVFLHPGVGASGAIWGIFASMLTWVVLNRRYLPKQVTSRWLGQLFFLFLLNIGLTLFIPFISKEAHFGGGIAGIVGGVPVFYTLYGPPWRRWLALAILIAAVVISTVWFVLYVEQEMRRLQDERADLSGTVASVCWYRPSRASTMPACTPVVAASFLYSSRSRRSGRDRSGVTCRSRPPISSSSPRPGD